MASASAAYLSPGFSTHLDRAGEKSADRQNGLPRIRACRNKRSHTEAIAFANGAFPDPTDRSFGHICARKEINYQKSWAGIVAGSSSPTDSGPKRSGKDGAVSASAASSTAAALPATRPHVASSQIPVEAPRSVATVGLPQANPSDLANMMSAAIEAALKPMKERLEITILPMQRTLKTLQAEFVALRSKQKGDDAADAKRMRIVADM